MTQALVRFALGLVFAMASTTSAVAVPVVFTADLSGPAEDPPNASPGMGFAVASYDPTAHTLRVEATFSDLLGTTTAAHIHCCTAVVFTGIAGVATQVPSFIGFPLGVTAGDFDNTFDLTLASSWNPAFITSSGGTPAAAEAALAAGFAEGRTYFNIHTNVFPGGEIRGFLAAVPEPSALYGLGLAVTALVLMQWRRVSRR